MLRANGLDAYLVQTRPEREDELWCGECDVISLNCIDSDAHAALWLTLAEKRRDEIESMHYETMRDREEGIA